MRASEQPLPGDIVIRSREDRTGVRRLNVFVLTVWPDAEVVVGGPYQSYGYALLQAREAAAGRRAHVWRDHSPSGDGEALEDVST